MTDEGRVGNTDLLSREKVIVDHYRLVMAQLDNEEVMEQLERMIEDEVWYSLELPEILERFTKMMTWDKSPELQRFSYVPTLIQTRNGRCGEWAQLFTALLYALGFSARIVVSLEDHVWTEVFNEGSTGWTHLDCTLGAPRNMNAPLTYRDDFKHKGVKCLAIDVYGNVVDVTQRYFP